MRRQAEEIAAANEELAPFRVLRGTECDILPDGSLDLPDDVLAELDWVQASVHARPARAARELTQRVRRGDAAPRCVAASATRPGAHHQPPAAERARPRGGRSSVALETGVALEVNGLPDRLDLRDEHVRLRVEAGVPIVVLDRRALVRGLGNMQLAVGDRAARRRDGRGRRSTRARSERCRLATTRMVDWRKRPGTVPARGATSS